MAWLTATRSWSALGGVLVTGVNAGGPPVMIWGWIGISCVSLCVAYSMAELCSEYPVAGGQYSWVYILAPKSVRRQFSYLTGWFMIIGMLHKAEVSLLSLANGGSQAFWQWELPIPSSARTSSLDRQTVSIFPNTSTTLFLEIQGYMEIVYCFQPMLQSSFETMADCN